MTSSFDNFGNVVGTPRDKLPDISDTNYLRTEADLTEAVNKEIDENIKLVGVSPQGYKIYEFNYIGGDARFRGAMAQDVLKKNPMAVGIDQNYLTVDYRKIDVAMEVA